MEIFFPTLLIRAPKVVGLHVFHHLERDVKTAIDAIIFKWLLCMPHIRVNHRLLTALAKRWHSERNTFHLPTGEVTITLKDVYISSFACHATKTL